MAEPGGIRLNFGFGRLILINGDVRSCSGTSGHRELGQLLTPKRTLVIKSLPCDPYSGRQHSKCVQHRGSRNLEHPCERTIKLVNQENRARCRHRE